jgi:hypothetical protein
MFKASAPKTLSEINSIVKPNARAHNPEVVVFAAPGL